MSVDVFVICTGIVTIGGAATYIFKLYQKAHEPVERITAKLQEHEARLAKLEANDEAMLAEIRRTGTLNREMAKYLLTLGEHIETGNNVTELKEQRKKLQHTILDN